MVVKKWFFKCVCVLLAVLAYVENGILERTAFLNHMLL